MYNKINDNLMRAARHQGKWFYFVYTGEWKSTSQVATMIYRGEKIENFTLRHPIEMLMNFDKINENTKEYSTRTA